PASPEAEAEDSVQTDEEEAEADESDTEIDLQEALEQAQAEASKNLEGWQRTAADLANYKRRQEEQAGRRILDMKANIVRDVLPALDDLDLAFQNLPENLNEQEANWVEGFKLVQRKLLKLLENNNIGAIEATGDFDPNLHEAVTFEENPEFESNTIIAELRKGYTAGDRVIRPALVRVAQ
ncbi:MAG: nucleotide exchange factor GrpE, partial [Chloroflexota bacterium]